MNFNLCGFLLRSELDFAELPRWSGEDRVADITVRFAPIAAAEPGEWRGGPVIQVRSDGTCRLSVEAVGTYLISNGNDIVIDPVVPRDWPDLSLFLLGPCLGILCHQRGLLPLHASCVAIGGQAIAFTGESGVGKSVIAAMLLQRGARLIADDITIVDTRAAGGPVVRPSYPRLKLWSDSLHALGMAPGAPLRHTAELKKYHQPVEQAFDAEPIRLSRVIAVYRFKLLREDELKPLRGIRSFDMMQEHVYRFNCARMMGLENQVFSQASTLVTRVRHDKLTCQHGLAALAQQINALYDQLAGEHP